MRNEDCFANKLVFTDGFTTFIPQYAGICNSFRVDPVIRVSLDTRDYYQYIMAGFATYPYPDLLMYTIEDSISGDFQIQPIAENEAINVTENNDPFGYIGFRDITLDVANGILLIHFNTFIQLPSLNLSWIQLGASFNRLPENSFNLTGGRVLTMADQLSPDVVIQLSDGDRTQLENKGICSTPQNCMIFYSIDLAVAFDGRPLSPTYGWHITRLLTPVQCKYYHMELLKILCYYICPLLQLFITCMVLIMVFLQCSLCMLR